MRGICLEEASVLRHATSGNTLRVGERANGRHFDCVCVVVRLFGGGSGFNFCDLVAKIVRHSVLNNFSSVARKNSQFIQN